MARQIVARQQGDNYQSRWFWLMACSLLDEYSSVERVSFEDDTLKSFDDVAVYYSSGNTDKTGKALDVDFYQVKFHVTSDGALTAEALCDPTFINATSFSLLQRIKNAHDYCTDNRINHRLFIFTPWQIHPDDPLAKVHSLCDGSIRWDKLAIGGEQSQFGKLRKRWKDHIGLESDEELSKVLSNVYLIQGPTLNDLAQTLNWRLEAKGLKPVSSESMIHPYDELTRKLLESNKNILDASSLLEICRRENLLLGSIVRPTKSISLGIRSFLRWAENLEHQTQSMVCFADRFEGRSIINQDDWNIRIPDLLNCFLSDQITRGGSYRLHLDTHSSIAFLAGYLLPEKMSIKVEIVQHTSNGPTIWSFENELDGNKSLWKITQEDCHPNAPEIALAIGLTHDIRDEVLHYIDQSLPSIGKIVNAIPDNRPSSLSVKDGAHATTLANQLIQFLRSERPGLRIENNVHIFAAAPNGFIFCLGRKMQAFPHWTLYEYEFGSGKAAAYSQSIKWKDRG